jgi:hypothetical protein
MFCQRLNAGQQQLRAMKRTKSAEKEDGCRLFSTQQPEDDRSREK